MSDMKRSPKRLSFLPLQPGPLRHLRAVGCVVQDGAIEGCGSDWSATSIWVRFSTVAARGGQRQLG